MSREDETRAATRVRVTASRRTAPPPRRPALTRELDEQTGVGAVYLDSLMRAHLRLSLVTTGAALGVIGGLVAAFALVPALQTIRVGAVPLAWLTVGVLLYPLALLGGWVYTRHSERIDTDFQQLVRDQSDQS